jgi:hypothetical protein
MVKDKWAFSCIFTPFASFAEMRWQKDFDWLLGWYHHDFQRVVLFLLTLLSIYNCMICISVQEFIYKIDFAW